MNKIFKRIVNEDKVLTDTINDLISTVNSLVDKVKSLEENNEILYNNMTIFKNALKEKEGEYKYYKIWRSGFKVMEGEGKAALLGGCEGKGFKDACDRFSDMDSDFKKYYSPSKLTYWGCKLYDNEEEARKYFG